AHAPQLVREYMNSAKAPFVRACGGGGHPQYYGASAVTRDGNVCRYSLYELSVMRTDPLRLVRSTTPPQTYMWVPETTCPSPGSINYAASTNVPQDVFEHLIHTWRDATSSLESFDRVFSGLSDATVIRQLRSVLVQRKSDDLNVLRVAADRDFGVWTRYRIEIVDSKHSDRFYAVAVSSWFGRTYGISGVSAGMYCRSTNFVRWLHDFCSGTAWLAAPVAAVRRGGPEVARKDG